MSWRSEQEQQIPAHQRMTSVQIARFIKHYERLTRWMLESEVMAPGLCINLDASHRVAQWSVCAAFGSVSISPVVFISRSV